VALNSFLDPEFLVGEGVDRLEPANTRYLLTCNFSIINYIKSSTGQIPIYLIATPEFKPKNPPKISVMSVIQEQMNTGSLLQPLIGQTSAQAIPFNDLADLGLTGHVVKISKIAVWFSDGI
jgi:hypothetical protein